MENRRFTDRNFWQKIWPEVIKVSVTAGIIYGSMIATQNHAYSEMYRYRDIVDINTKRITVLETEMIDLKEGLGILRAENKDAHELIIRMIRLNGAK